MAYRNKRGTLNVGMRLEYLLGQLSWQVGHAVGGKQKFSEVVRYHDPEPVLTEMDMTGADFAKMYGAVLKKPKPPKE